VGDFVVELHQLALDLEAEQAVDCEGILRASANLYRWLGRRVADTPPNASRV
jgi:hypothetical protein